MKTGERTVPQIHWIVSQEELWQKLPPGVTYDVYREIRKDPTIALARRLILAAILSSSWSVEADDDVDDHIWEFIEYVCKPLRRKFMEAAAAGMIDFGWQTFEKVYVKRGDRVVLDKLKPLLHDMTLILIDENTGEYRGVKQAPLSGHEIILGSEKAMLVSIQVEGTYWYGQPLLENVRAAWKHWNEANKGAKNYDKRIAGDHWVVYYPPGTSILEGEKTDNALIAIGLLKALENSGSVTVPRQVTQFVDELGDGVEQGWKIEMLEAGSGQQSNFNERLRYLDSLKVRGLMLPERSVLEGQFGTKAEAGEHGDLALSNIQGIEADITHEFNEQVVNPLLVMNFGEQYRDKVWVVGAPLIDEQARFLKEVYRAILNNPEGFAEESMTLDTDAMKDSLGLPKTGFVEKGLAPEGIGHDELEATQRLAASLGLKFK